MNIGAVAGLENIREAIAVAKHVLENTRHTLLVGTQATNFAIQMGFTRQSLVTPQSAFIWNQWQQNNCQPNFWQVCYLIKSSYRLCVFCLNSKDF